jgi:hypothetical protein
LAESWNAAHGGRQWELTLRAGARFWDGSPVTAADVVACWRAASSRRATDPPPWIDVAARSERLVVVFCDPPRQDLPRALARPEFAVTKPADFSAWPVGSGLHRPGAPEAPDAGGARTLTAYPTRPGSWLVLRFRVDPASTAQQLLDAGVDLLICEDPSQVVAATSEFASVPLPASTLYAVACASARERDRLAAALPETALAAIARDVVRGPARAAVPPFWWSDAACAVVTPPMLSRFSTQERIVYPQHDTRARSLAERLVALGVLAPRAEGLPPEPFAAALRGGQDAAYVLPIPVAPASPCAEAQSLAWRAPWLASAAPQDRDAQRAAADPAALSALALAMDQHLFALVATGSTLIARHGLVGIGLAGDGTPRLERLGWEPRGGSP